MSLWYDHRVRWKARLRRRRPGRVEVIAGVESPQLGNRRDLFVYLPGSYPHGRYGVIYMQDGQNLFDPAWSFAGSWMLHEALDGGGRRGLEAIVVGIANAGPNRLAEYSPFPDPTHGGGRADLYLDFVLQTVKPLVDERFRTYADRRHTGIAGSSMGGLLSLYAFFRHPGAFGAAGVMSPSLWFGDRAIVPFVASAPFVPGRVWLDIGSDEGRRALDDVRMLRDLLLAKGYQPGRDVRYIEEVGARHEEAAWGRRFHDALPFLLGTS